MRRVLVILGILVCVSQIALAQTLTTAEISGLVTDSSNAIVPNARVTALSKDTGDRRNTKTNSDGYYTLPLLLPSTYILTVQADGFETVTRDDILVGVEHSVRVDFKLKVGSVKTSRHR